MADRIKGITVQIGGDTTGLSKALKQTNSEINSTKSQLKDVERLLKLDPTNTELLAQKEKLLNQAVGETKTKLDALKDAEKQVQEQFKNGEVSEQQYMSLKREIEDTENQLKELESQATKSNAALSQIGATAEKVASGADKVASATRGLSTAASATLVGLGAMAVKSASAADDLNTLAKQSGFSTEQIQKWKYASDMVDVSVDTIVKSAGKMKKNMISTSSSVTDAWERLGISVRDDNNELRDSTEVFNETVAALGNVANETERDTLAMTLFGKSADELAGIIDDGGAALNQLGQEAEDAGVIMSQDALDSANEFNDALDRLKATAGGKFMAIGAEIANDLLPYLEKLADVISKVLDWFKNLDGTSKTVITTLLLVTASISPLASAISKVSTVVSFLSTKVLPALSSALSFLAANPIVLVIAGIAALIAAIAVFGDDIQEVLGNVNDFLQNIFLTDFSQTFSSLGDMLNSFLAIFKGIWDSVSEIFNGIIDFIRGTFTGDWERAWNGVSSIFKGIFDGLVTIAKAPVNLIIGIINGLISAVNFAIGGLNKLSIDVPSWVPGIGGETWGFNIDEIPKVSYLAKGGILSSGTAVVGEAGPEILTVANGRAVVQPLSGSAVGSNGLSEVISTLNQYLPYLAEGNQIVLDTGTLVGATAPAMNREFGRMAQREARR